MEHCQSNLNALRHQYLKFSESMIRQIMRDICMGLKHLHKQRIVHLDIKPGNKFHQNFILRKRFILENQEI